MSLDTASLADRGQRLGLRLIAKAGGLPGLKDPKVRARVQRYLYKGAVSGFKAQTAAGRAFARQKGSGDPARAATTKPKQQFDLTPTEDQEMIRGVAKELADEVIRPAGATADAERSVPAEVTSAAAEVGLHLVGVPAELDGIAEERSAVTGAIVLEELARGDMGIATAIMAPAAVATAIAAYGDADQQATYLPEFTGETPPTAALARARRLTLRYHSRSNRASDDIARLATIPHGDSVLGLGVATVSDGPPSIPGIRAGVWANGSWQP